MKEWYQCTGKEVLDRLETGADGLNDRQVLERRNRYGENRLKESGKVPAWKIFLEQFQDLLVLILIGAAVISMVTDNVESTVVIFAVITLNAVLGTVQHQKAQKSLESLKSLSAPTAAVLRNGRKAAVPSVQVVPGDILYLEAGDLVVADGRILESSALYVNESSLTGESDAVLKSWQPVMREVPLADRTSMAYSGSLVTGGRGTMVVTATGMETEIGNIAMMMNDAKEKKTPLEVSLDQFGSRLAAGIMVICLVVFLLSLYRKMPVLDSLMFAVALAVAAIPEALGSIVTIVQAMGTQKMAKEQAIIKDLKAVESLGCVSVICTDKTGTLTQNRMSVEQVVLDGTILERKKIRPENPQHRFFMEVCALVNDAVVGEEIGEGEGKKRAAGKDGDARKKGLGAGGIGDARKKGPGAGGIGDATELALLEFIQNCGLSPGQVRSRFPRIGEIPFDSQRKMMSTIHKNNEKSGWGSGCLGIDGCRQVLLTKGAVDVLLDRCRTICDRGKVRSMTSEDRRRILEQNLTCSRKGFRVLALVYRPLKQKWDDISTYELEQDYTFLGMAAMMDPPRPETIEAVADAKGAGIRPVMITGDHKVTAMAIAEQIGLRASTDLAVTGPELNDMKEEDLERSLETISVYARVSPEHKMRVVRAWQKKGHIVAMTGDGVNDAPALKQADIGIAMGRNGTEVSKDAAAMILADDNFATIIKAVANGRNVYRNIRNAIQFLLSGNMAGILCVLYTTILALPTPFAPVHLLFINLLTDSLPAIAIGMEPPERGLLDSPPRDPKKGILTGRVMRDILFQGLLIAVCTMCAYQVGLAGDLLPDTLSEMVTEIIGKDGITFSWLRIMAQTDEIWRQGMLSQNAGLASTMAFSTLTLARLFHGFNCRSRRSLFRLGLFTNLYTVMAFEAGVLLMAVVLFVPAMQTLFSVEVLNAVQLFCVVFFAFLPTAVIQAVKMLRE